MVKLGGALRIPLAEWLPRSEIWVGLVLSSFLINIFGLFLPMVLLQVYDRIIPNQAIGTLILMAVGVFIALSFELMLKILRSYVSTWADARLSYLGSKRAFQHLIHSDLKEYESKGSGVHLERINALDMVKDFFGGQAITTIIDVPFLLIYFILIVVINKYLALVSLIMMVFLVISAYYSGKKVFKLHDHKTIANERKLNFVMEVLSGIHTVKALGMEEQLLRRYERLHKENVLENYKLSEENAGTTRSSAYIAQLNLIIMVAVGAVLVMEQRLSVGGLSACVMLAGRCMQPLSKLIGLWAKLQLVRVAEKRNEEIFEIKQECPEDSPRYEEIRGDLEMSNVSFKYMHAQNEVIKKVNFSARNGQCVAILGGGLSGKTTLLSVMSGLLAPISGEVLVNGTNLYEHYLPSFRSQVAYLPQNGVLFEGTILENLTLFRNDTLGEDAKKIAKDIGLHEVIEEMQNGYDTKVGYGTVDSLSRGVKQRIIIARAFINKPKIVFFDEANTAMDIAADVRLKGYLQKLKGSCTLILVTHRPSLLSLADKKYELKDNTLMVIE